MNYRALATDYDGTLAHEGRVDDETLGALDRLRASGRRLVLVTGRELEELLAIFPRTALFDRVVAENGALLYRPADGTVRVLGPPPSPSLVAALEARGVAPLSVGRVIVATRQPHEAAVREAIRCQPARPVLNVILNKRAVMVLPRGIDKASGLAAALDELGVAASSTVAVGDAENDLDFLALCGLAVAVANALDVVKAFADVVTEECRGAGIAELIEHWLNDEPLDSKPTRRSLRRP